MFVAVVRMCCLQRLVRALPANRPLPPLALVPALPREFERARQPDRQLRVMGLVGKG
eukprot:SAG22_NODE_5706_length_968_cov_0.970081_1_plen_56_part_10